MTDDIDTDDFEIEVADDTPEQDRGRAPMPKEIVDDLEKVDELEDYSEKVKSRLVQLKKVWHDERREKERAQREAQAALDYASRMQQEATRLRQTVNFGEKTLVDSWSQAATLEAEAARKQIKEAFETGDGDKLAEAQGKLAAAEVRLANLKGYVPSSQAETNEVNIPQVQQSVPQPDRKTRAWQERNEWFGTDEEMTAAALGLHQKLQKQNGASFVGSDEYWQEVDATMRRRFPDYFGEDEEQAPKQKPAKNGKAATVVAPATRSTSSKKIVLTQSQVAIAKRLGVTLEQYARELARQQGN